MAAQLKTFSKNVAIAGTAERLSDVDLFVRELAIQAKLNVNNIYVGGSDVTAANGIALTPFKSFVLTDMVVGRGEEEYVNLKDVWINADTGGEGAIVLYVVR